MEDGILMNVDPKSYNEVEVVEVDSSGRGRGCKMDERFKEEDERQTTTMQHEML